MTTPGKLSEQVQHGAMTDQRPIVPLPAGRIGMAADATVPIPADFHCPPKPKPPTPFYAAIAGKRRRK